MERMTHPRGPRGGKAEARVASLPSLGGSILTPLPSLPASMGVTLPRPGPFLQRRPSTASPGWRARDLPGSWGTPADMPRSSTPADPTTLATAGRAMLPSAQKTASAPRSVSFRGSITRPAHALCTLRSRGHPLPTQHSVPAGAYPLPGQDFHLLGSFRSFRHVMRATWLPLPPGFAWRNSRGNVSAPRVRRRHRRHAAWARGAGRNIGRRAQTPYHSARPPPGPDQPGPRVPLSRLPGAPLRRPSSPALGRGWSDPARQPGAPLPAAPPRGARGRIHRHAPPRRHGALLPARRPAAPDRATRPTLGRFAARTDVCSPSRKSGCIRPAMHPPWLRCFSFEYSRYAHSSCLARGAPRRPRCDAGLPRRTAGQARCRRHHDRSAGRGAPLARRAPGRSLGNRRPVEATTDWGGPWCRSWAESRAAAMSCPR